MADTLGIMDAIKYSLKRKKGLLNFYWLLIPIVGLIMYCGYFIQIYDGFRKNKRDELPVLGDIAGTLKSGFFLFVFSAIMALVLNIVMLVLNKVSVVLGFAGILLFSFVVFVEVGLYLRRQNFHDALDFNLVFRLVKMNVGAIVVLWIKSFVICIIFGIVSALITTVVMLLPETIFSMIAVFITVLVILPIMIVSTSALSADFYVSMYKQIEKKPKESK